MDAIVPQPPPQPLVCLQCGTHLAPLLQACPVCHSLVHAEELKQLAVTAGQEEQAGQLSAALATWRRALDLLPRDSRQFAAIAEKVAALSQQVDVRDQPSSANSPTSPAQAAAKKKSPLGKAWGWIVAGLGLALTKGKLLLVGLTKMGTLWTMLLSFGVYWTVWGWKFAAGLVISIYIHEMGHVAALAHFGIKASAPMFIPGFGALVRMKQHPVSPIADARVGLAGPWWGLGAALGALGIYAVTQEPIWAVIARVGAWINLFNLLPVPPLDGGRGLRSLSRGQRFILAVVMGVMWVVTNEGLLGLLTIIAAVRAFSERPQVTPDHKGLAHYALLVVALSAMCLIPDPLNAAPPAPRTQLAPEFQRGVNYANIRRRGRGYRSEVSVAEAVVAQWSGTSLQKSLARPE